MFMIVLLNNVIMLKFNDKINITSTILFKEVHNLDSQTVVPIGYNL